VLSFNIVANSSSLLLVIITSSTYNIPSLGYLLYSLQLYHLIYHVLYIHFHTLLSFVYQSNSTKLHMVVWWWMLHIEFKDHDCSNSIIISLRIYGGSFSLANDIV
jgi:hypothetical protein